MCVCMYVCMCVCVCVCMHVYVCMYVCMYVYIYIYIYIYIYSCTIHKEHFLISTYMMNSFIIYTFTHTTFITNKRGM